MKQINGIKEINKFISHELKALIYCHDLSKNQQQKSRNLLLLNNNIHIDNEPTNIPKILITLVKHPIQAIITHSIQLIAIRG